MNNRIDQLNMAVDTSSPSQAVSTTSAQAQDVSMPGAAEATCGRSEPQVLSADQATSAESLPRPTTITSDISSSSSSPKKPSHGAATEYETNPWQQFHHVFPRPPEQPKPTQWHPSILRIAPLVGLAALVLAVLLLFVSYAVLSASDGDEVARWNPEPNVYLAILTAVSNKAVAFAAVQGTVVTFWLRALRGTTLGQLHRDWGYGVFLYKAVFAGRNFNLLALACICATLVAVDGPLLQRSSTVQSNVPERSVDLQVPLVQQIPSYTTGYTVPNIKDTYLGYRGHIKQVIDDYTAGRPLRPIRGCPGACSAKIRGPALAVDSCSSSLQFVNFSQPLTPHENATYNNGAGQAPTNRRIFSIGFGIETGPAEKLLLATTVAISPGNGTCAAYVNTTICRLVSAIAEYPVSIENDTYLLSSPQSYPDIIDRSNNTALTNHTIKEFGLVEFGNLIKTTLSGIAFAGFTQFRTVEYLLPYYSGMTEFSPTDVPFNLFALQHTIQDGSQTNCVAKFSDPRDQIMASLNELMFRTGAYFASSWKPSSLKPLLDKGVNITSNVTGVVTSQVNVFHTDYGYFAGAATIELFAICTILFTFYGFWNLGRDFSFSPLEIGKAFDAPILRSLGCHLRGREIAKIEGRRQVQYGVLKDEPIYISRDGHFEENISIADKTRVSKPSGHRLGPLETFSLLKAKMPKRRRVVGSTAGDHA